MSCRSHKTGKKAIEWLIPHTRELVAAHRPQSTVVISRQRPTATRHTAGAALDTDRHTQRTRARGARAHRPCVSVTRTHARSDQRTQRTLGRGYWRRYVRRTGISITYRPVPPVFQYRAQTGLYTCLQVSLRDIDGRAGSGSVGLPTARVCTCGESSHAGSVLIRRNPELARLRASVARSGVQQMRRLWFAQRLRRSASLNEYALRLPERVYV